MPYYDNRLNGCLLCVAALPLSNVPGAPAPGISFDRFVRACVAIKTLTEAFQRLDTDRDGWIQINYDTFLSVSAWRLSTLS